MSIRKLGTLFERMRGIILGDGVALTGVSGSADVNESGSSDLRTTTGTVKTGAGLMTGFYVNSTTAGTIVFYDAVSATNALSGTVTPAIGWHAYPVNFATGLHVVIANMNVTIIYK